MIYFYYMYYQLNLVQKIILLVAFCSIVYALIVIIKASIFMIQWHKERKEQQIPTKNKKIRKEIQKLLEELRLEKNKENTQRCQAHFKEGE